MVKANFVAPPDVDWPKVIRDLQNAGLVGAEVARRLNLSRAAVSNWRLGKRKPSGDEAIRLAALHAWAMQK